LIDSEKDGQEQPLASNRQRFAKTCRELGIDGHVLERRALENYFSAASIARAFPRSSFQPLGHFENKPPWSKRDNWRIAAEVTLPEIAATDLGAFLNSL